MKITISTTHSINDFIEVQTNVELNFCIKKNIQPRNFGKNYKIGKATISPSGVVLYTPRSECNLHNDGAAFANRVNII